MSGADYERELKDLLIRAGCKVIRSAGSMGDADLTAIRPPGESIMIIEAKKFTGNVFSVKKNEKMRLQWFAMIELAEALPKATVRYALRSKRDVSWRLVRPEILDKPYHWDKMNENHTIAQAVMEGKSVVMRCV